MRAGRICIGRARGTSAWGNSRVGAALSPIEQHDAEVLSPRFLATEKFLRSKPLETRPPHAVARDDALLPPIHGSARNPRTNASPSYASSSTVAPPSAAMTEFRKKIHVRGN